MENVLIRRQFNDGRIGCVTLEALSKIHWSRTSGGVSAIAPQLFIHAYVWCHEIAGNIPHSCMHGPPPHHIKVVIVQKDNSPEIFKKILKYAGPKPPSYQAKPYNHKLDVKDICNALINNTQHPAIEIKKHKIHGEILVIKPKNIKRIIVDGTNNTIRARAKKVKLNVRTAISIYNNFREVKYGYWLSYKKV